MKRMRKIMICICMMLAVALDCSADGKTYYRFEGKMGGKVSVVIAFQVSEDYDDLAAGYIYYPKAKNPAPILLVGNKLADNRFMLREYQPDGKITGDLYFQIANEDAADGPTISEGEWSNQQSDATYSLTTLSSPYDMARTQMYMPDWYEDPMVCEDPAHIGREYSYQIWHLGSQDWMGGHVSFRGAGKNKLHFDICNAPSHIAEGKSDPGRPAVLEGSEFEYKDVNECGYSFHCTIFKKFLVINTTSGYDTLDCFGAFTAFDAVYIKTKD